MALYSAFKPLLSTEVWVLLGLCLAWILSTRRSCHRIGTFLFVLCVLALYGLSTRLVSHALLVPLEGRYPPVATLQITQDAIVILTGGAPRDPYTTSSSILSTPGLARLICGLGFFRMGIAPTVVLSGGDGDGFDGTPPEAVVMRDLALELGLPAMALLLEDQGRTTSERGRAVRAVLPQAQRILLVDSALHLPRSALVFQRQGFGVTPAPCDYQTRSEPWRLTDFYPGAHHFYNSSLAFHEYIGLAAYWLLGDI